MEQYLKPEILIPVAFAALFAIWYFLIRKKPTKEETAKAQTKVKPLNIMLYDRTTYPFSRYESVLDPEQMKIMDDKYHTLGRQLLYGTKKLVPYFKGFVADEIVFEPVFESLGVEDSPKELFIDTRHHYAEVTEKVKIPKSFMQKHGHLLIFLFGLAFLAFMILQSK
jgi:hypothetical protein